MTTTTRATPLAMHLADIGARYFSKPRRYTSGMRSNPNRSRALHDLSDWILRDVGFERQDTMSPEARRAMTRLNGLALW